MGLALDLDKGMDLEKILRRQQSDDRNTDVNLQWELEQAETVNLLRCGSPGVLRNESGTPLD